MALDAADADAVEALFDGIGHVDHVASFTGEQPHATVGSTTHEVFQRALDARVWAARNLCASGAPRMRPGGSFTFCSGVSAWRPRADRSAGAVATAALESFGRAMAVELAPIRVNTICPGSFDTPVLDRAFGDRKEEVLRAYLAQLPLGRLGRPEEIAHAVLYLMTATYVTGTVLHVDGGSLLI
jgi:NAD(P)-dependent dehydrogenase (short-subunit alcohol dehydrogenase family)